MRRLLDLALRILAVIALYIATHTTAHAAQPRLSTDCSYAAFTPSEATPFDLDWCSIAGGDDISLLLDDIRSTWPTGFYVRAPSRTLSVTASYRAWAQATKTYMFLEDQSSLNRLTITQIPVASNCTGAACLGFWNLWRFTNWTTVKIGGPNLSITFIGTHPGFANCDSHAYYANQVGVPDIQPSQIANCDINEGLLDLRLNDGASAQLLDVRANVRYAQQQAIYLGGSVGTWAETGGADHVQQVNVAGLMYASGGISLHQGARNVWLDPDRTVIDDPYMRMNGWQGQMSAATQDGRPVACAVPGKGQQRTGSASGYYTDSITGGITIRHAGRSWVQRYGGRFGTGVKDPFIVRFENWGVTGPIEKTCPYPGQCTVGARARKYNEMLIFKGDPHDTFDAGGPPVRFVRFIALPSIAQGYSNLEVGDCAHAQNGQPDGMETLFRLENNVNGRLTRDWSFEFVGDWRTYAQGGPWHRGELFSFGTGDPVDTGRVYRNTLRVADGTVITDTINLADTTTVTGSGTFTNLGVADGYGVAGCTANTITNTNVSGSVAIAASCGTTTISNVRFTGAARAIITIGTGSTATVSQLCAPAGSTITGTGTLNYNGSGQTLPFTITSATTCAITADPVPAAPTGTIQ